MLIYLPTKINLRKARKALQQGEVIIYPTDTLYGLGADIFNKEAVKKVFRIKGREFKSPLSVMVSSLKEIKDLAWVNKEQEKLMSALLPGPFTFILKKKTKVSKILTGGKKTIGVRIPNSKICQKLSKNFPITTTSANISGFQSSLSIKKIIKEFSQQVNILLKGDGLTGKPSIIVDLTEKPFKFFRF